jgi:hypothetical protein
VSGPGIAKARPSCECVADQVLGYGACGCFECSECGEESVTPLETVDFKDGEYGPKPYRPCRMCGEVSAAAGNAA